MATQAQLDDARAKLHALKTDGGVVTVETEAGKVTYAPPDVRDLEQYVADLERQLTSPQRRRRGAIGVRF